MRHILKMINNKNNMEIKWGIEKKYYTMTKNRSAVKNKASTDKVFKTIMDKLASLNQVIEFINGHYFFNDKKFFKKNDFMEINVRYYINKELKSAKTASWKKNDGIIVGHLNNISLKTIDLFYFDKNLFTKLSGFFIMNFDIGCFLIPDKNYSNSENFYLNIIGWKQSIMFKRL